MKGLMSTAASRAWLGVAAVGLVVATLVPALGLIPRLSAGQRLLDTAGPAFGAERVAGTSAGVDLVSDYVDVVDPLLTARGGARGDVDELIALMRRRMGLSDAQVRRILRREAPHVEALTRALPLDGIVAELPRLTSYLATTLVISEEQAAALLEQDFPRLSQLLTALRDTAGAWYDVPGIDGLTRLKGDKPVRSVPGLRKYLRDDLVPVVAENGDEVRGLAGSGGVGYIPYLLLLLGLGLLAFGVAQARAAARVAPGRLAWGAVAGVGLLLALLVVALQYFPRLSGGQRAVDDLAPLMMQERLRGARNGTDALRDAIAFGDPILTARGGATDEESRLYRVVARRSGRRVAEIRAGVRRRAPRTVALLRASPLSQAAGEVTPLTAYLSRALRLPGDELVRTLRKRVPALTQSLLALGSVTVGWNQIPQTAGMTRLDGRTPVRTMPQLDAYLREDLLSPLLAEREDFDRFADRSPPLDAFAPLLLLAGVVLMLYAAVMMQFVASRD